MPNTDTQLATLGAMAQLAMDMHTDDGDTRDTIIENLTTIHMRDPEGAAQLLSVAIWLIAQNMCADDVEADGGAEAEPTPAADPEFGQYSLDIRYSPRDAFISLTCDGREVASFSGGTPVAVIVDRVLKDMEPAEPEPVLPPLRGTISPAGQLEIAIPLDWHGEAKRAFHASVMRTRAEALLREHPELAGQTVEVTFDRETFELTSAQSWRNTSVGDASPFVDAGPVNLPWLKVAVSPEGAMAIRVGSEWVVSSLQGRHRLEQRVRVATERLLGRRPELRGSRLSLLWNPSSGEFEQVDWLDPAIPMPSGFEWRLFAEDVTPAVVGAEMGALSDDLEAAGEALKTPPNELAARLDQIRTGEIRFPGSWKQPMPKLAEGGVIKSGKPYLVGEENMAEPHIAGFRTDADIRDEEGMKGE